MKELRCPTPKEYQEDTIYSCPIVYCPTNPLNPDYGNYNTTTCAYDKYINKDGKIDWHFGCIKTDYCNLLVDCTNLDQNSTGMAEAYIGDATDWGKKVVRYITYGCDNGNIEYTSFRPLESGTNNLNPSSLIIYMLSALFILNFVQKFTKH